MNEFGMLQYAPYLNGYQQGQQGQQGGGLGPLSQMLLFSGLGNIASSIGGYLGGGQARADQGWARSKLKGQYGKQIFDPHALTTLMRNKFLANAKPMATSANKRLGLDSGRALSELIYQYANQEGATRAGLTKEEKIRRSQRDLAIPGQVAGLTGRY